MHSAITFAVVLCAAASALADIHVSPAGADTGDGSAVKPFVTLAKAVEASHAVQGERRIIVHGGDYYDVSVALTADDSGLTIQAAGGEKPVLHGGVVLGGWKKDGEHLYAAPLPEGRKWEVRLLQVDGRMCARARFPEAGTLTHASVFDVPWMSSTGGGWKRKPTTQESTTLKYKPADLPAGLDIKSAEITVYHMWDESVAGAVANDVETHTLTLAPPLGHPAGAFGVKKYVLWNIKEGLTRPGTWYHDRAGQRIVYWPLDGQDMSRAKAIVATAPSILRIQGTQQRKAHDIVIRGLSLAVTTVPLVTGGFGAANFDGAVSLLNADNCTLAGLSIAQVAGHAVNTRWACNGTRVEGCEISSCGAGGIYVGGENAVIASNHVHGVGMYFPSAIGIFRGGKHNTVAHNEVHDCSYSAINYGGTENIIEDNLIYDCMKVLHDGAAIYLFGAKNCIIRRNFAHDITDTGGYGASAYYLDEQSEGCIVERNLSVNVGWPTHNHMARNNTIRNNVFVVKGDAKLTFPRSSGYTLEGNVLYAAGKIRIEGANAVTTWSKNVLYSGAGKVEQVMLKDYSGIATTQRSPADTETADPLFVDMEKGDYRYKEGSPATKLGLQPIDVAQVGRKP